MRKPGRPRKTLTDEQWEIVEKFAKALMKAEDIAAYLGIDRSTLYAPHNAERFKRIMATKSATTRFALRSRQLAAAMDPKAHPAHLIFALKNHDGQTDRTALTGSDGGPIEIINQAQDALAEALTAAVRTLAEKQP